YNDLDKSRSEIRLLRILPATKDDCTLRCELFTFPLQGDYPRYVALSYVWGDTSITENIFINGSVTPITKSLALALRRFRDGCPASKYASFLWADVICVNQSNIAEKTHQVRMMAMTYERAACVMSWLG
ncbi:HET-domain-containing protein, partial [Glonium stellatum]